MKKHKSVFRKIFSSFCVVCLCVALIPAFPVLATNVDMDATDNVVEFNIVEFVNDYMNAREDALIVGTTEEFYRVAVEGIVADETSHREKLLENNITITDLSFLVTDISINDIKITVELSETVSYDMHGMQSTDTNLHTLIIMFDENNSAKVVSDIYVEDFTEFQSCSYVNPEDLIEDSTFALGGNSSGCLVYMAKTQIGYKEKASNINLDSFTANAGSANYTKYGAWYGINPGAWCAMFVSWCARQVNIPTSVIPQYSSCTTGMNTFIKEEVFEYSSSYGGSYTPKVGDIFFVGTSKSVSTHTGIVVNRSGNTITVVDGNWNDQVSTHTYSLSDSSLIGFASPNYSTASHTWVDKGSYYQCSCCGMTATVIPGIS